MKIEFQLSGLGDVNLEKKIIDAVESAGYSDLELSDIRCPAQYSLFDLKCDLSKMKEKLFKLQQITSLTPNIFVPQNVLNIKTLLKKLIAKFIKWYIVPMAESQSSFNYEISTLFSETISLMQIQKEEIIRLNNEIYKMRKENV